MNSLADLRVFGAIGFQDAPNELWLGKQGYQPQKSLLKRIVDSAFESKVGVVGITSEDDAMIQFSPEDRFGFLRHQMGSLYPEYIISRPQEGVFRFWKRGEKIVYLVNAETIHAPKGSDWHGVKLHVVGGNCLPKKLSLAEAVKEADERGYMTFLMGVGASDEARRVADTVAARVTGIIEHDATNTFWDALTKLPKVGPSLRGYSRSNNALAKKYAESFGKPGIAVSSAHWMHEIGRAGINFELTNENDVLGDLRTAIKNRNFTNKRGHNNLLDVLRFGHLLQEYGGAPDRFKGADSSYNRSGEI